MQADELLMGVGYANIAAWEQMQLKHAEDPSSVPAAWQQFFSQIEAQQSTNGQQPRVGQHEAVGDMRVGNLIEAYRTYGHLMAKVNPLVTQAEQEPWQLQLVTWGLSDELLDVNFPTQGFLQAPQAPLQQIVAALRQTYCNKIGFEYMGTQSLALEQWLQQHIEPTRGTVALSIDEKRMILEHLNRSELFEIFLHTKYTGQKRFSLEGGETLIPMIAATLERGFELGMREFVLGMAHRGRLNVLSNILNKSYGDIFSEFEEWYIPNSFEGSGDVKYHKGFSSIVQVAGAREVKVSLAPNPSHLDAVDPVVEGITRALQTRGQGDMDFSGIAPILIHGDAALSGQGVIYETLQLYRLHGYSTGGTIHIVINNQIGFTTLPSDSRSTRNCTDIARAFGAPVFHVNAEDPEGCIYAVQLAVELRQKFHCDVFLDLNCYRKYGHNEGDEPAFTQPLQYQVIRKKPPIREIYRDALIHQGVMERHIAESLEVEFKKELQKALEEKAVPTPAATQKNDGAEAKAKEMMVEDRPSAALSKESTAVPYEVLHGLAQQFSTIPEGFSIHRKLKAIIIERLEMVDRAADSKEGRRPIDWGMAETLAYATLLTEGTPVRLSGQDSCRGTFSHRHAIWVDQEKDLPYSPLSHLSENQGRFDVLNSPLSEYGVLGFEYGYTLGSAESLVIWEAQFGDFCNGAQIIVDQFISTGEQKWGQKSNIVLFLPHGYEGQGPEHSSARMERFLTLSAEDNMSVVTPTTPAQLFHLLRRQAKQQNKRPLIVFTPKGLLRHQKCVSSLEDLTGGGFQEVIEDPEGLKDAKTLVFCSGRVFYDLQAERSKENKKDLALLRIEQLHPFPEESIKKVIERYSLAERFIWVQEEPQNMGAWEYMRTRLLSLLPKNRRIKYIGRSRSASPASGSHARHKQELEAIFRTLYS